MIFALFLLGASPLVLAATATLSPTADAYVQNGGNTSKNYGTATDLRIQTSGTTASNYDSYLKFDTTSVAGGITSAQLRIYAKLSASGTVSTTAYAVVSTTWGETTITWNNKPALGIALGSVTVNSTTYAYKDIDVTSYVQSEFNAGRKVMSFAYRNSANSTPNITAYSKDSSNVNKPQLLITYATNVAPTVGLTSPANNALFVAPASVSLTATAADSDGTIAKVEYYNGATLIGTSTTGPSYAATWNSVAAGTYTLTSRATDNLGAVTTSAPITITVTAANVAPSVTLTAPANNASVQLPATVTLSATAADSDGTIAKVEFYDGVTLLNTDISSPYSSLWANPSVGSHTLTAIATDDKGASTTSSAVSITVSASTPRINYTYDEIGRLTGIFDDIGNSAQYIYDAVGNLLSTTRKSAGAVTILEFTPKAAQVGATVTLSGTGFSATPNQNSVSFNGTAATVTAASANSLTITVPTGATSGPISVTSPSGSATSSSSFTVSLPGTGASAPAITSFTPKAGGAGETVTISGVNFQSNPMHNIVTLDNRFMKVGSASSTALTVALPTNSGTGKIKVTTPYGSTTSVDEFYVAPLPYKSSDVEVTARMDNPGLKAVSIATPGKIALIVFDGTGGQTLGLDAINVTMTSATVSIYMPDKTLLTTITVGASGGTIAPVILPITGIYTILIAPASGVSGGMSVRVGAIDLAISGTTLGSTTVKNSDGSYTFPMTYTVTNNSMVTAPGGWYDLAYLSVDGTLDTADQLLKGANGYSEFWRGTSLAPGESYTVLHNYISTITTVAGNYTLLVKADGRSPYIGGGGTVTDNGNVIESNETNNIAAIAVTLPRPDLVVSKVTSGRPKLNSGIYSIPVTFTVTNQGTETAPAGWYDVAYLSADGTLDVRSRLDAEKKTLSCYNYRSTSLASGAAYTVTMSCTANYATVAGSYIVFVHADGRNVTYLSDPGYVNESDETNNMTTVAVTLP